jgi:hypothetical protein
MTTLVFTPPTRHRAIAASRALRSGVRVTVRAMVATGSGRVEHTIRPGVAPHFRGREISVLIERVFDLTW